MKFEVDVVFFLLILVFRWAVNDKSPFGSPRHSCRAHAATISIVRCIYFHPIGWPLNIEFIVNMLHSKQRSIRLSRRFTQRIHTRTWERHRCAQQRNQSISYFELFRFIAARKILISGPFAIWWKATNHFLTFFECVKCGRNTELLDEWDSWEHSLEMCKRRLNGRKCWVRA